ncbi:MAG: FecR domain-containing protein [Deltaproteobacteria bacterium]|nr:FecR domain-containing protein [Deltaproteobacteria bacterium]
MIFLALPHPSHAAAGGEKAGRITVARGKVFIKRPGAPGATAAREKEDLMVGDLLTTGRHSTAQVEFTDTSFVNIAPESSIRVNQYSIAPDRARPEINRRKATVRVISGKARFVAYKELSWDSALTVETDTASAIATDLVDYVVRAAPGETEVLTLAGAVTVSNASRLIVGEIFLGENQFTKVSEHSLPAKPAALTPQQRDAYIRDVRQIR